MEIFWLVFLIFAITAWPYLLFKRMRKVREQVNDAARAKRQASPEYKTPFVETETMKSEGGLSYQRGYQLNEGLIEAEKEANAMPDINKTLQGKR